MKKPPPLKIGEKVKTGPLRGMTKVRVEAVVLERAALSLLLEEAWLDGRGASKAPLSTTLVKAAKAAARIIDANLWFARRDQ